MKTRLTCAMAFAVLLATGTLLAQTPAAPASAPAVDGSRLPVDTARIQRALRQSPVWAVPSPDAFWNYYVEVRGRGPEFRLFGDTPDPLTGPAWYGAPTHSEMFMLVAPQEFRASTGMAFRRSGPGKKLSR